MIKSNLKKKMYLLFNQPYIPPELKDEKGPLLLHISDTPEESYKYIIKVIDKINPQYIVHTGDIVDNIKLGTNRNYLSIYENALKKIMDVIEDYNAVPYYIIGNHDDINSVIKFSNKGIILEKGIIEIEGHSFYVSHEYEAGNIKAEYCLFGHDPAPVHYREKNQTILNGLLHINIIALSTGKIYQLEYPIGTDYYRKIERRSIGL